MAPEDDFGFVHLVSSGVRRFEAGGMAGGAIGVDHAAACPADEMVVIVARARLETEQVNRTVEFGEAGRVRRGTWSPS